MTSPHTQEATCRFSLRQAMLALTAVTVAAAVLAPFVRVMSAKQAWLCLLALDMLLVGWAVFTVLSVRLRRRAQGRGGALVAVLGPKPSNALFVILIAQLVVAGTAVVFFTGDWGQSRPPARVSWVSFFPLIVLPLSSGQIAAYVWSQRLPVEAREEGLVVGWALQPWNLIIGYRWFDDRIEFLQYGFTLTCKLDPNHRLALEALLAEKIKPRGKFAKAAAIPPRAVR